MDCLSPVCCLLCSHKKPLCIYNYYERFHVQMMFNALWYFDAFDRFWLNVEEKFKRLKLCFFDSVLLIQSIILHFEFNRSIIGFQHIHIANHDFKIIAELACRKICRLKIKHDKINSIVSNPKFEARFFSLVFHDT